MHGVRYPLSQDHTEFRNLKKIPQASLLNPLRPLIYWSFQFLFTNARKYEDILTSRLEHKMAYKSLCILLFSHFMGLREPPWLAH